MKAPALPANTIFKQTLLFRDVTTGEVETIPVSETTKTEEATDETAI